MKHARLAAIALSCTLAACGEKSSPPAASSPAVPAPAPGAPPPDVPKVESPPPSAPAPSATTTEPLRPAPPKPAARVTKDASGEDWASHMGDIPFALDSAVAMDAAAKAKRPLMLYFTSPG